MSSSFDSLRPGGGGRGQRRLRNLLLDPKFQLKYTGYLVLIALLLSGALGGILFRTSQQVIAQSEHNVAQGQRIVSLGREVVDESRKVSAVVRMNIVKDPVYQDNPDLLDAFNSDAAEQDRRLESQTKNLEVQSQDLAVQADRLRFTYRRLLFSVISILGFLVLAIGAAGIFVTHKVAGPIFKMRRHLREVAAGDLRVPSGLRKGDELVEFFAGFQSMVSALRARREEQLSDLGAARDAALAGNESAALDAMGRLERSLRAGLE